MIPFFDLKRLYRLTEHDVDREIRHVLETGHYILGEYGKKFEEELKTSLVGNDEGYALGCNSGTDALILPLLALDIDVGDEVIVPSHTAIPTIAAIRATGAVPVFCDLHPETWVLDVRKVAALVTENTKAIIAVHVYGNMVNIFELNDLLISLDRHDIKIIEDVAQAQGSKWKLEDREYEAGTIGDFGSFSFYPTKNIGALGDAGAIFTKDAALAEKMRMLRNYGQKDRYNALIDRGMNSRLDEMQAAILMSRMKYLDRWKKKKDEMTHAYRSQLDGLPVQFQKVEDPCNPNWHLCVIKCHGDRDAIQKKLLDKGVQTLIHYPIPTHMQAAFKSYAKESLTVTEDLAKRILSLPMNVTLMPEELQKVVAAVKECVG